MASSKQEAAMSGPSSELGLEKGGADTAEGALRPSDILGKKLHRVHLRLVTALKRRQVAGSYDVACQTIQYLRQVIGQTRWRDVSIFSTLAALEPLTGAAAPPFHRSASDPSACMHANFSRLTVPTRSFVLLPQVATLIQYIRCLGRELVRAQPVELTLAI